jgi:hypothetical protein
MEGPVVAPWQEDVEHPREAWVFVSPVVGSERRSVLEHLEHGPGTRATYHGPRHSRDLWAQARAAVASQVLLATEELDPAKVRAELARDPDPLRGYLAGVVYSGLRRQSRETRSWPRPLSLRGRLEEYRRKALERSALPYGLRLWQPGDPPQGTSWATLKSGRTPSGIGVAVALPRWWLWRGRWPSLHPLLREAQPLRPSGPTKSDGVYPVHVASRSVTVKASRFRLPVKCHVVLAWQTLPSLLDVWLARQVDADAGGSGGWVLDMAATAEWRKTLDPEKVEAARHDWQKLVDLC